MSSLPFTMSALGSCGGASARGPRGLRRATAAVALFGLLVVLLGGGTGLRGAAAQEPSRPAGGGLRAAVERLRDAEPRARAEAFATLERAGADGLRIAFGEPWPAEPWARRLRLELFARGPALEHLAAVGERRSDAAAEVRRAVADALGAKELFGSGPEREAWLLELLEDAEPEVRNAARQALIAIDRPAAAEALLRAYRGAVRHARVDLLRALTGLRAARPLLLDLRRGVPPADRAARLELAYALGGAALHAQSTGRLDELVDVIAVELGAADADLRTAGEFAVRSLDFELRAALQWEPLERALLRLVEAAPQRALPLQRLAVLRAFDPAGKHPRGAESAVALWRSRWPDPRFGEGREARIQGGLALGLGALLRGQHDAAAERFRAVATEVGVALLRAPADRWGGWMVEAAAASEAEEEELFLDPELWEEEIARRGLERRRPVHHFDLVQRDLVREEARARFFTALCACLDPGVAVDPAEEMRLALERLLEGYALSVAIEGFSFRAQERLPNFGENVDLVFEGETGLYELLYALARRGRAGELPAALERFAAHFEAQGAWAARELAAPGGYAEEPEVLDLETFVRYRRRNPSRFRIVWAQLLLDSCGAPEAAQRVYSAAIEGYGASTRDWPWAARLEAQAVQGLASCHMARRDADAVELALSRGLARLEELQRTLERTDGPGGGDWLRADLAALFVSRAVNENVLRGDPAKGMAHIRRALELDPSDFNWVLAACYHARAGNADEARAILARVPPQPAMSYNRGCTLALLGAADEALVWLEVDLRENHLSEASKQQQARWAWGDPDLRGLQKDPRFEALYGPRPR